MNTEDTSSDTKTNSRPPSPGVIDQAIFGGGCFWCMEAVFEKLDGVISVTNGYAGGTRENPTYKEVCADTTGHAEVVRIEFDPQKISYARLLEIFWEAHDPTTLNRQGADVGSQYRSVILYRNETQKETAERSKQEEARRLGKPLATQIVPLTRFYPAEDYHQDYFRNHPNQPYCRVVIRPKLLKLDKILKRP